MGDLRVAVPDKTILWQSHSRFCRPLPLFRLASSRTASARHQSRLFARRAFCKSFFGLSLRASCGYQNNLRMHSDILDYFDRCASLRSLYPPLAAVVFVTQRATLVGLITESKQIQSVLTTKKEHPPFGECPFFGCGGRI